MCEHYQDTLLKAQSGSVVYCDPPYAPLSATANFTAYHTNSFSMDDQRNLARLAYQLSNENDVPVLISNHETPLTLEWYAQAKQLHRVSARRTISSKAAQRSMVNEL